MGGHTDFGVVSGYPDFTAILQRCAWNDYIWLPTDTCYARL